MTLLTTTIKHIRREQAWQKKYNLKAPKEGSPAPDFKLFDVNGTKSFHLSEHLGRKPVVLVFGSFS